MCIYCCFIYSQSCLVKDHVLCHRSAQWQHTLPLDSRLLQFQRPCQSVHGKLPSLSYLKEGRQMRNISQLDCVLMGQQRLLSYSFVGKLCLHVNYGHVRTSGDFADDIWYSYKLYFTQACSMIINCANCLLLDYIGQRCEVLIRDCNPSCLASLLSMVSVTHNSYKWGLRQARSYERMHAHQKFEL